jgi:methionyl aminopeptidase
VYYEGFHGDCSATFLIGNVDKAGQKLVSVAEKCRDAGVAVCGPGVFFSEIGRAIRYVNAFISRMSMYVNAFI